MDNDVTGLMPVITVITALSRAWSKLGDDVTCVTPRFVGATFDWDSEINPLCFRRVARHVSWILTHMWIRIFFVYHVCVCVGVFHL